MAWRCVGVAGVALLCAACMGSGGKSGLGKPVAVFPSSAELENVAKTPVTLAPELQTVEVDSWQLTTAVPAPDAEYLVETRYDQFIQSLVAQHRGRLKLSPALACAAREAARFYVENGAYPTPPVQGHLVARCGGTAPSAGMVVLGSAVDDAVPDDAVHDQLAPQLGRLAPKALPRGLGEVGAGYSRGKGRAAVVVFAAAQRARLDGFSPLIRGDRAVLEGEAPSDAAFGIALVNQGANGVALCEPDRAVRPPRFRFVCPVSASDDCARIEVATRKQGQMLLTPALSVLVRRSDEAGLIYQPTLYGNAGSADDAAAFQQRLLQSLNQVRSSAGMRTLSLEPEQSKTNARVAPHWFHAALTGDQAQGELVALGVMAGWNVQGTIRGGGIYTGALATSRSPGLWLSQSMQSPLARWVLLDPEVSRIAIGAERYAEGVLALLSTYSFFESNDHAKDEDQVFRELTLARRARQLSDPTRAPKPEPMIDALAEVSVNAATTEEAMSYTLAMVSDTEHRAVSGWIVETSDLKDLPWDDALFAAGPLDVSIGVTHYKAKGAAWGQYAVLIVAKQDPGSATQSARSNGTKRHF